MSQNATDLSNEYVNRITEILKKYQSELRTEIEAGNKLKSLHSVKENKFLAVLLSIDSNGLSDYLLEIFSLDNDVKQNQKIKKRLCKKTERLESSITKAVKDLKLLSQDSANPLEAFILEEIKDELDYIG